MTVAASRSLLVLTVQRQERGVACLLGENPVQELGKLTEVDLSALPREVCVLQRVLVVAAPVLQTLRHRVLARRYRRQLGTFQELKMGDWAARAGHSGDRRGRPQPPKRLRKRLRKVTDYRFP
jgi:hypothetical protein